MQPETAIFPTGVPVLGPSSNGFWCWRCWAAPHVEEPLLRLLARDEFTVPSLRAFIESELAPGILEPADGPLGPADGPLGGPHAPNPLGEQ